MKLTDCLTAAIADPLHCTALPPSVTLPLPPCPSFVSFPPPRPSCVRLVIIAMLPRWLFQAERAALLASLSFLWLLAASQIVAWRFTPRRRWIGTKVGAAGREKRDARGGWG